jgi:hypothetical protein
MSKWSHVKASTAPWGSLHYRKWRLEDGSYGEVHGWRVEVDIHSGHVVKVRGKTNALAQVAAQQRWRDFRTVEVWEQHAHNGEWFTHFVVDVLAFWSDEDER